MEMDQMPILLTGHSGSDNGPHARILRNNRLSVSRMLGDRMRRFLRVRQDHVCRSPLKTLQPIQV